MIHCIRKSGPFTDAEIEHVSKMSETAQMCLEGIFLSQKQVVAPLVATKSEEEFQINQRQKRAFGLLAMRSLYKSKTVDLVPEAEQYGGTNILYNL